ncbi:telomerase reverse transcriptase-like [Eriocheir sinensis]|uniref:telomerase reverse transcriptase-like n=1 Tax=Eriocheir sinensis TaxID=95602 RepID=UPI0021C63CD4|nr:telomerase reverse transcriptase-like [Eriocheir sinensis]
MAARGQVQGGRGYCYKSNTEVKYKPHLSYTYVGFPKDHILRKAEGENGMKMILRDILNSDTGCQLKEVSVMKMLGKPGFMDQISMIQDNFRKFNFSKIEHLLHLEVKDTPTGQNMSHQEVLKLLKASPFCTDKQAVDSEIKDEDLACESGSRNFHLSNSTVFIFLKEMLQTLVPESVWGSQKNFKTVERFLWKLIDLGAQDTLTIGQLLDRMKLQPIRWLQVHSQAEKKYVLSKFFIWILQKIIIASLKAFVVTSKISGGGNQIFFFRKGTFCALSQENNTLFTTQPDNAEVQGKVKLLPKRTGGVRPLFMGVNKSLDDDKLKASMWLIRYLANMEEGFKRPPGLVEQWKNALSVLGDEGDLYYVKTDIKDAFGSVDTSLLKKLLYDTVSDSQFFEEFKKLYTARKGKKIPKYESDFYEWISVKNDTLDESSFTLQVYGLLRTIDKALCSTVTFGKRKVTLASGLPQGCCLSGDLCNFYYSKMTSEYLHDFVARDGVLLRTVDDFLYISKSREMAIHFKDLLTKGIHAFNCFINKSKTLTNCSSNVQRILFNGYILCFSQKAVLINNSSLERVPCRYSLTFNRSSRCSRRTFRRHSRNNQSKMNEFIENKLVGTVRIFLPHSLISERYSNLNTLLDNVWRLGMISGYKIQALLNHACDHFGKYNSKSFLSAIFIAGNKVFQKILRGRTDFGNEDKYLFTAIFVCSIYCSLTVISRDTRKVLTRKLSAIVLRRLRKVESTDQNKVLLKHLENLVTGSVLG